MFGHVAREPMVLSVTQPSLSHLECFWILDPEGRLGLAFVEAVKSCQGSAASQEAQQVVRVAQRVVLLQEGP